MAGKKKAYTALLQRGTFLCQNNMGATEERFGGRYGFPGFYRAFVRTTGLENFSLRQKSSPKDLVVVYPFFFSALCLRQRTLVIKIITSTFCFGEIFSENAITISSLNPQPNLLFRVVTVAAENPLIALIFWNFQEELHLQSYTYNYTF